jgi:hypothetical protein
MVSNGAANDFAFVSGVRQVPIQAPGPELHHHRPAQLAASRDAVAFLDELAVLSPDLHDMSRPSEARPFIAVSFNPQVELSPERIAGVWQRWEECQGLVGLLYAEWTHGKRLDQRSRHFHRLYLRIRVDGDGRIVGIPNDWARNELASTLAAFDNRDLEEVRCHPGRHAVWVCQNLAKHTAAVNAYFMSEVRRRIAC